MIKILIADKLAQEGVDLLNEIEGVEPVVNTGMSEDELCEVIGDYDGIIIRSASRITPKVLERATKLRGVARAGVGVDNIDIPACTAKGVLVMNTPGGNTLSAAEHSMALMLSLSRNVVPACNSLKGGAWDRKSYMGNQLNKKVLGVIGMGRIGMSVVKMALGFNMRVLGYDPIAVPKEAESLGIDVVDDLEQIWREADYISLHVPRNEHTIDMISAKQLDMMKPSVRIVNCARGGIINANDLYDALAANKIAGAALDVYDEEPPVNRGFEKLGNCLVTPHLGASTVEAQVEVAVEAAQILSDALTGGAISNALNAPSSGSGVPDIIVKYTRLSEQIGELMCSLLSGAVKEVELAFRGSIAEMSVEGLVTSFLIGLLKSNFDAPVNIVNVGMLAKSHGISIDQITNPDAKDLANSLTVKVVTDKVTRSITATVFGGNHPRIVGIDGYDVELTPEGTIMVIFNDDKPGVIGAFGTLCGVHGINICTMGVGYKNQEGSAILAVSLDRRPDANVIGEIKELEFVNQACVCTL